MNLLLPILIMISTLFVVFFLVLMLVRMSLVGQANRILDEFSREEIIAYTSAANFMGQESKGVRQWRGNGFLLLTTHLLMFERLKPGKRISIPLQKIQRVDQVSSFLGKRKTKPVLRVLYTKENTETDSVGITVPEPQRWQKLIQSASLPRKKMVG
jgi:hypothetical protein